MLLVLAELRQANTSLCILGRLFRGQVAERKIGD